MALEIYVTPVKSSKPQVKITERGSIIFNLGSRQKFKLDENSHIVLYYDAEKTSIFARPVNDADAEGALSLRQQTNTTEVAGQGFKKHFKIEYNGTKMFDAFEEEVDGEKLIRIDLKKGREEALPKASRRGPRTVKTAPANAIVEQDYQAILAQEG